MKEIRGVQRQNLLFVFGVALCLVCRTVAAQPARPDPAKKMEALKHLRAGLAKYNEGEYHYLCEVNNSTKAHVAVGQVDAELKTPHPSEAAEPEEITQEEDKQ